MPLSEEEQRLLEQLEHALAAEDPSLASALRGSKLRARNRRHAIFAAFGFVAGIALLMVGVISTVTALGVAGFVIMLGSVYLFLTAWRSGISKTDESDESSGAAKKSKKSQSPSRPSTSESFMQRMEERWRRRRDSGM